MLLSCLFSVVYTEVGRKPVVFMLISVISSLNFGLYNSQVFTLLWNWQKRCTEGGRRIEELGLEVRSIVSV